MAEGEGQERIAGEDGGRLVEGLMDGRAAAAEVVVVHRRQVVVDQRIAMDQLDGGGGGEAELGGDAQHPGGLDEKERPQPLAALERAVPHGGDQPLGRSAGAGERPRPEKRIERPLDFGGVSCQLLVEVGHNRALPQSGRNH